MMVAASPLPGDDTLPREDHRVVLRGLGWADYQRLLELRGDRSAPRIAYLEGVVEIMSPSRFHESIKSVIGCLVEVWCLENNVEFGKYGAWTLENKELDRGVEPDECYVFGENDSPTRPDLAIEVIWTSGGINKLEIYRKLDVGEVWFWRGGQITVYVLVGDQYEVHPTSKALSGIDLSHLVQFLDRSPTSRAIREYRESLRQ